MSAPDKPIPLGAPTFGDEELDAVREVLASGWVAGQGPRSRMLEERFAERCGVAHAVAVNNCTAGLHLALLAMGTSPGDEVVVADYTFPATGHAVLYTGATPVFVDVRPDLGTIAPDLIAPAITPRTKGIIAVDTLGQAADYERIEQLAAERELFLIEDAACSAGGTYRGRPTGSFGDVACFSFHGRKGITCGEGGIVTTDHDDLAATIRKLSSFGMESAFARQDETSLPIPVFDELGFNYKLSDVLAAIALVQVERLDELVERRRQIAERYRSQLVGVDHVVAPVEAADRTHVWQTYAVSIVPPIDRGAVAMHLREAGVQCNIGTYASHLQPVYGTRTPCPESARLLREHLAIPMHANLTDGDVERVVGVLTEAVERQLDLVS